MARKPDPKKVLRSLVSDFARRVAPIYQKLVWEWAMPKGEMAVPWMADIELKLREMIANCEPEAGRSVASGGLRVGFDQDGYPYLMMEIMTKYTGCAVVAPVAP
jgi:hypothetical protein